MATFPDRALAAANAGLSWAFDRVLGPFAALPAPASLLVVSLATAAAMLFVVARTSDQVRMREAKRAMRAGLFEMRLFGDDLAATARAFGEVLRHNLLYLRLSLVPLLWMAVPLLAVIPHLQAYYGYGGLLPGQPALVEVELAGGTGETPTIEAPPGIRVDTPAARLVASPLVLWRIVPTAEGDFTLTVRAEGQSATKQVHVSRRVARRSPWRGVPSVAGQVLYPSEPPLDPSGTVRAIAVKYPEPGLDLLGWRIHWMVAYAVLSMAAAFLMARRFGVTL